MLRPLINLRTYQLVEISPGIRFFSFFRITDYCFFKFCHTVISIRLSRFFSSFFADFFLLFWFLFTFQVSMIGSAWGLGSAAAFNQNQKESKRISVSTPRPLSQSGLAPIDISTPHYWAVFRWSLDMLAPQTSVVSTEYSQILFITQNKMSKKIFKIFYSFLEEDRIDFTISSIFKWWRHVSKQYTKIIFDRITEPVGK